MVSRLSKVENGSSDPNDAIAAEFVNNPAALTSYKSVTYVLAAGTTDQTRVCKVDFAPDKDNAFVMSFAQAIDGISLGNLREVKQTIGVNSMKDKPNLTDIDKYIALITFKTLFGDGREGRDYIRVPYSGDESKYAAIEAFFKSAPVAGVPNATRNAFTTDGALSFKGSPVYYEFMTITKAKDRS